MNLQSTLFVLAIFTLSFNLKAQLPTVTLLDSFKNTSIRGLSVVNNKVVWCSGSNGFVAKSTNGGNSFTKILVTGYEKRDFRDIEAFDANTAIIMAIAEPALLLKTTDGGIHWKKVLEDSTKNMFLDALFFANEKDGVVVGDPINNNFYQATTNDGGDTWQINSHIKALPDEAFFASSGGNVVLQTKSKGNKYWFVSSGAASKLYSEEYANGLLLPITQGSKSTGANAIALYNNKAIIVGGDFVNPARSDSNCVLITLGKKLKFSTPEQSPIGYKSSVQFITHSKLVACGTSGIDISSDGGKHWQQISNESFHVVQKAKHGKLIILAGAKGRIGKLNW